MANNNQRDDSVAASNSCNNGMELASSTTSNLAVSLTAILLVSGIHNNGMELVLTTQRPTSQNHSPP
jgi:hypothetical protein